MTSNTASENGNQSVKSVVNKRLLRHQARVEAQMQGNTSQEELEDDEANEQDRDLDSKQIKI